MIHVRLSLIGALALLAACSTQPPASDLTTMSGLQLYQQLCASCHGVEAKGDGPVAPLIKIGVPDLTRIAAREGGEFPTEDVRRTIDGRFERPAHGPRDMPVWGWQLYDETVVGEALARTRTDSMIDRLVEYLKSIQG
jgi:mono/diheme cytochrome c family protein